MENEQDDKKSRIRIRQTVSYADAMALKVFCKSHAVYGVTIKLLDAHEEEKWADVEINFRADTRINFNRTIVSFFLAYAQWLLEVITVPYAENPN
jgi:hypothetical protein